MFYSTFFDAAGSIPFDIVVSVTAFSADVVVFSVIAVLSAGVFVIPDGER